MPMKIKSVAISFFAICILIANSCKKDSSLPPIDENVDLDGGKFPDSSLITPSHYLLSAAIPNPTPADLAKPVVITVHGFTACNFEWTEFRDWAKGFSDFNVSLVLLGGHGRDYETFKKSTWEDWQAPIIDEYNKLRLMGYQKINFVASSTGCPLVLDMIAANKIDPDAVDHLFFIDPIIIPSNKTLSLVSVVGPFIGYTKTTLDPGEKGYWYKYRPQQALKQLEKLTRKERKDLEKGITLPAGVTLKVYKSESDGSADPASAVLLNKGVKTSDGNGVDVEMVLSELHVFTRLHGRALFGMSDIDLQIKTFQEIHSAL
jgi:carboxylesterase